MSVPPSFSPQVADAYASPHRPVLSGALGAVAAAHPLAVAAGQEMLVAGGSAVDAAIAAQAVLCVVAPEACGLGGDALCLVREPGGAHVAVNGAGAAPAALRQAANGGALSVTVPGIVGAWDAMSTRWGRLPFARLLVPATRLARAGITVSPRLARDVLDHKARLLDGGAGAWGLLAAPAGGVLVQNELATALDRIAKDRSAAFYGGELAGAIVAAVARCGGCLSESDLAEHRSVVTDPVRLDWRGVCVSVQPPMTQGVLLALSLRGLDALGALPRERLDHAGVELTEAAFAFRDRAGEGAALLAEPLTIDLGRAARRGGPRAYLHTAGVAASDRFGMTVSSLVSVFDDFGSAVFVPEGGFVLNNRGAGFTAPPNDAAGGKRPAHTLAPALIETADGAIALATPGADGQVQTLLQVLSRLVLEGQDLAGAIARPRWRSENGRLLIEAAHEGRDTLRALGHDVVPIEDGNVKFGAVVCAGHLKGRPVAVADWRREAWAGVA